MYNHSILRFLQDPADLLSLIRDEDRLVAFRLPKDTDNSSLVVFTHQHKMEYNYLGKQSSSWKMFGIPLLARINDETSGIDIHDMFLKLRLLEIPLLARCLGFLFGIPLLEDVRRRLIMDSAPS